MATIKCSNCPKDLTNLNEFNRNKHIVACKSKNNTPKNNKNLLAMNFIRTSSSGSSSASSTVDLSLDLSPF